MSQNEFVLADALKNEVAAVMSNFANVRDTVQKQNEMAQEWANMLIAWSGLHEEVENIRGLLADAEAEYERMKSDILSHEVVREALDSVREEMVEIQKTRKRYKNDQCWAAAYKHQEEIMDLVEKGCSAEKAVVDELRKELQVAMQVKDDYKRKDMSTAHARSCEQAWEMMKH